MGLATQAPNVSQMNEWMNEWGPWRGLSSANLTKKAPELQNSTKIRALRVKDVVWSLDQDYQGRPVHSVGNMETGNTDPDSAFISLQTEMSC